MQYFNPLSLRSVGGFYVESAQISSKLDQLFDPGVKASIEAGHHVTILVVGHDVPNLTRSDYDGWRKLLAKWLEWGVKVEYIALDESETLSATLRDSGQVLGRLVQESGNGSIEVFIPKSSGELDPDSFRTLKAMRKAYRTSHFLLGIDDTEISQSQMWLEGDHQPGDTEATDCWYFGATKASGNAEFYQNRSNFEFLKGVSRKASFAEA